MNGDFFTQLKNKYSKEIIPGKRRSSGVLAHIRQNYGISLIDEIDKLDCVAQSKIEQLRELLPRNEQFRKNKYI
ncbi:MAG: hypothetical protein N2376_09790 [Clostridia bacterium]|nr:hypothetical protein [Clostridia bacterium]